MIGRQQAAHPVGEALEQGIGEDKAQRGRTQGDAVGIQLQQDAQSQEKLGSQEGCKASTHLHVERAC